MGEFVFPDIKRRMSKTISESWNKVDEKEIEEYRAMAQEAKDDDEREEVEQTVDPKEEKTDQDEQNIKDKNQSK